MEELVAGVAGHQASQTDALARLRREYFDRSLLTRACFRIEPALRTATVSGSHSGHQHRMRHSTGAGCGDDWRQASRPAFFNQPAEDVIMQMLHSNPSGQAHMRPHEPVTRYTDDPGARPTGGVDGRLRAVALCAMISALCVLAACGGGGAEPDPGTAASADAVSPDDSGTDEGDLQMGALAYDKFKGTQDGLWIDEGPCTEDQMHGPFDNSSWTSTESRYLVNRHKLCARILTDEEQIDIELEKPKDGGDDQWRVWTGGPKDYDRKDYWTANYGAVTFQWSIAIYGPPDMLKKTVSTRVKIDKLVPNDSFPRSARSGVRNVTLTPTIGCTIGTNWNSWRCPGKSDTNSDWYAVEEIGTTESIPLQRGSQSKELVKEIEFKYVGSGSATETRIEWFVLYTQELKYAIADCGGYGCSGYTLARFESRLSDLRCDVDVLAPHRKGCVFPAASAVMTLAKSVYPEIHAHMLHAFTAKGAPGLYIASDDNPAVSASTTGRVALHWAKDAALTKKNRTSACKGSTSIIAGLIASGSPDAYSSACRPGGSGATCSCDEFPFASSWEGASNYGYWTSARMVKAAENSDSGSDWGAFLFHQRVLPNLLASWGDDAWIDLKDTVTPIKSGGAL